MYGKHLRIYITSGPHSLYKNVFIRTYIYSEINTFGLPTPIKISFAFIIFVLVQKMFYLKVIQKITPMDVSVSENIGQKTYLKEFRGGFTPLSPP